jgi:hypothetical protein
MTPRTYLLALISLSILCGCGVTSRLEPYKQTNAVLDEDDRIVILPRRHHASHETEVGFVDCVSNGLAQGSEGLGVYISTAFEDRLYPWFEPSTAPLSIDDFSELMENPDIHEQVRLSKVRFIIWLDGSTDRVAAGGGISCAAGVAGAGCMGLAWWEDDARYDATIWDVRDLSSAGTIYADYNGRSVMPALIVPIPLIARPQAQACRGLTDQLKQFLTTPEGYEPGPELSAN